MNAPSLTAKLVLLALVLPAVGSAQQRIYRWIDENGNQQFGDRVPPQYADQDLSVLNSQGIVIERQQGLNDEQRAEQARLAAEAEAKRKRDEQDRRILNSYTKVSEIEAARDRRLALMDAQIANTEKAVMDLRTRLAQLQQNAGRYKPYSSEPNAREIPETLANNIKQTETSIVEYEARIVGYRKDRAQTDETFSNDIRRFKELKGL